MTDDERIRDPFEQRVASYLALGWEIVERQDEPPIVRLSYRQRRLPNPRPSKIRDTGERVIWVDEAGEVRVERSAESRVF